MQNFLKTIKDDFNFIEISDEVSTNLEAAGILRKYPRDVILLENIKESDIKVIAGICNTREKIAKALNTDVVGITKNNGCNQKPCPYT